MNFDFGNKIKELRKDKEISQDELARLIGTTKSTICKYENGNLEPNLDTIRKFSTIFEVTTDYLLGLEDYPNYNPQPKAPEPRTYTVHIASRGGEHKKIVLTEEEYTQLQIEMEKANKKSEETNKKI